MNFAHLLFPLRCTPGSSQMANVNHLVSIFSHILHAHSFQTYTYVHVKSREPWIQRLLSFKGPGLRLSFFLWTSRSCYNSLGSEMRSGKRLGKSTEKMALGSQLGWPKWLEVTWMTGAGDLLLRQRLHDPPLWDHRGWRTSSVGVVGGASVCAL